MIKEKSCICVLWIKLLTDKDKAFNRVPRKMLKWALRMKGIPNVFVRSVMSLQEGAKTKVIVDSELSEEIEVKVEDAPRIYAVTFSFWW